MSPVRIVICGVTGRMGSALMRALAGNDGLELVGGIAGHSDGSLSCPVVTAADAGEMLQRSDVLIDFSSPGALGAVFGAHAAALEGKGIVIGTTGLGSSHEQIVDGAARRSAIVTAANFSIGVNLLLDLVQRAARVLDVGYDIEITEAHHRSKVDAPSGTALALGRAAAAGRGVELDEVRVDGRSGETGRRPAGEIALHALRGGSVIGEHHVHFLGDAERIELTHLATDRLLFAQGALQAAAWVAGRAPGRYTMHDVLGL